MTTPLNNAGTALVPKLQFVHRWEVPYHRSGWAFAIRSLRRLEKKDGILFDSIVDKKFSFGIDEGDRKRNWTPYTVPWIGILHNPPYAPSWFGNSRSAGSIISSECWQQSIMLCRGLFTLSEYLAAWLRPRVVVPVSSLYHPTDVPTKRFSFEDYRNNRNPSILHIGWWLRKIHSFYLLRTRHTKVLLHTGGVWVQQVIERELALVSGRQQGIVTILPYASAEDYDALLAWNIAFLDFYDASANNAVIECIARHTPLIVNRHPALEEYLGPDYPLFFDNLADATELADSPDRILQAHIHLQSPALQRRICPIAFCRSLHDSQIYQSL